MTRCIADILHSVIDLKFLRDQPESVRASQRARGEDESLVDAVIAADDRRRTSIQAFEAARSEQKAASKELGPVMGRLGKLKKSDPDSADIPGLEAEAAALRDKGAAMSARVKELEAASDEAKAQLDTSLRAIGNVIQDGVPAGGEEDFDLIEEVGTPRDFAAEGFAPKDHLELGELLGAIDMERGAKVSGSRFYYLKGAGAQLEMALMGLAQQIAAEEGFTPLVVPSLVRPETMAGTGYLDAHDDVYHLQADDLYLTGTSEVALAGFHADEILDLRDGPIRYVSTSTCFRREAGSYGKDTRGIFRVHQFQKTEMFVFCRPEDAVAEHDNLLRIERRILEALELPYRVEAREPQVRLRGVGADAEQVPGADLDEQLHHLPGPPVEHPRAQCRRGWHPRGCHAQRHGDHQHPAHRGDPGEPPAGRWLDPRPRSAPALHGARGHRSPLTCRSHSEGGPSPRPSSAGYVGVVPRGRNDSSEPGCAS